MRYLKNPKTNEIISGEDFGSMFNDWIEVTEEEFRFQKAKTSKLAQITSARNAFMYSDVEYLGSTFTNTQVSGNNLTAAIVSGEAIKWLDSKGNQVDLTLKQAKELSILIKEKRQAGYFQEAILIAKINACSTLEEVEAITINFN